MNVSGFAGLRAPATARKPDPGAEQRRDERVQALCDRGDAAGMSWHVEPPRAADGVVRVELWNVEQTVLLDVHPGGRCFEA